MPPNRLAVRCASSGVYWNDNIFMIIDNYVKNHVKKYVVIPVYTSRKTRTRTIIVKQQRME